MKRIVELTAATLAGVMGLSCGSDKPAAEGPIAPACAQYASSRCDLLDRCAPTLLRIDFGTRDACTTQMNDLCMTTASLPGAALKTSAVSACASELAASSCEQFQARVDRPFCDEAGGGTLGTGAACTSGYQCASRACFSDASGVCGSCQAPVAAGGGCRTSLDCPNGTTCSGYVCLPASGVGGTCDTTHACGGYLLCVNGQCEPSPAAGEACAGGACSNKLGLNCDTASQTCQAISIAAEGDACGMQVACEAHGACVQGTCKSAVGAERPCDSAAGPYCQVPAMCVGGWCKIPDATTCP